MVKFKVDENLPDSVAQALRDAGYDAASVLEQQLGGCRDSELAKVCREEGRVMVSLDLDFADIRTYPPADCPGIVVFRLRAQGLEQVLAILHRMIKLLQLETPENKLWIVEEHRVRVRE